MKYCFNLKQLSPILMHFKMQLIHVMGKVNFQQPGFSATLSFRNDVNVLI